MKRKSYALLGILFLGILPLVAQKKLQSEDISRRIKYYTIEAYDAASKGDYNRAAEMYSRCLALDSKNANVHYELANLAIHMNDVEAALEQAKLATELAPNNNWYQLLLAQVMEYKGMLKQSAQVCKTLSRLEPQAVEYYMKRCALLTTAEEWDAALEAYDDYTKQFGAAFDILAKKQELYDNAGKKKEAYAELQHLVKNAGTAEKKAEFMSLLALRYSQDGEEKKAQKIYKQLKNNDVQNGVTAIVLAGHFIGKGDYGNAASFLAKSIGSEEIAEEANVKVFVDLLRADTTEQANARIDTLAGLLVEHYPENAIGYAMKATADEKTEEQKLFFLQKALDIDPTNYSGLAQMTQLRGAMNQYDKMKKMAQLGIEAYPQQYVFYYLKGIAASQLKEYDVAESSLQTALIYAEDEKMRESINGTRADTYYKTGDVDRAFQIYEELLEKNPENTLILNNYSYFLSLEGKKLDKAQQMIEKVMIAEPESPTYLDTYAWILYRKEEYQKALKYMKKAIAGLDNDDEGSAEMREHYGDILEKTGDEKAAVVEWKKAVKLPDAEVERLMEKIEKHKK